MEHVLAGKGPRVVTTSLGTSIREAVATLGEHNIGALVVVDDGGYPRGILSERDIVRELARRDDILDLSVADLMTADVVCGAVEDDVQSVLRKMTDARFRHLPIVQDGVLAGMVTIGDLVKAQLAQFQGQVDTLQTQLMES